MLKKKKNNYRNQIKTEDKVEKECSIRTIQVIEIIYILVHIFLVYSQSHGYNTYLVMHGGMYDYKMHFCIGILLVRV